MTSPQSRVRILIAEDHTMVREGLKFILSLTPNFEVIAETGDGGEAEKLALELCPDLLLLDIDLPSKNGFDVATRVKHSNPGIKILILTGSLNAHSVRNALALGVEGYVLKREDSGELMSAVQAVLAGKPYISKSIAEQFHHWESETVAAISLLGAREREVVVQVADGKNSDEIAESMHISVATVRKHRENIMRKLNLRNAAEIAAFAVKHGLHDPS